MLASYRFAANWHACLATDLLLIGMLVWLPICCQLACLRATDSLPIGMLAGYRFAANWHACLATDLLLIGMLVRLPIRCQLACLFVTKV